MAVDTFTSTQVAELFGMSPQTVRVWTHEDQFGEFFSDSAKTDDGATRLFTEADIEVIAYIWESKKRNAKVDAETIRDELRVGNRGDIPRTPAQRIEGEVEQLRNQLQTIVKEREQLQIKLGALEIYNKVMEEREKTYIETINKLNREVGKLQAKIELLQEDTDK